MEISRAAPRWRRSAFRGWLATGDEVSIIRPPATVDAQGSRQSIHLRCSCAISSSKDSNNTQQMLGFQKYGPVSWSAVNFVARLKERFAPLPPVPHSAWSDSDPGGD